MACPSSRTAAGYQLLTWACTRTRVAHGAGALAMTTSTARPMDSGQTTKRANGSSTRCTQWWQPAPRGAIDGRLYGYCCSVTMRPWSPAQQLGQAERMLCCEGVSTAHPVGPAETRSTVAAPMAGLTLEVARYAALAFAPLELVAPTPRHGERRYLGFCELHQLVPLPRQQWGPRLNGLLTAAALPTQGYLSVLAIVPASDAAHLLCCSDGTPLRQSAFINDIQKLLVAAKSSKPRPLLRLLVPHRDFHLSSALWNARMAGMRHGPVGERDCAHRYIRTSPGTFHQVARCLASLQRMNGILNL